MTKPTLVVEAVRRLIVRRSCTRAPIIKTRTLTIEFAPSRTHGLIVTSRHWTPNTFIVGSRGPWRPYRPIEPINPDDVTRAAEQALAYVAAVEAFLSTSPPTKFLKRVHGRISTRTATARARLNKLALAASEAAKPSWFLPVDPRDIFAVPASPLEVCA